MQKKIIIMYIVVCACTTVISLTYRSFRQLNTKGDYLYQEINDTEIRITKYLGQDTEITIPLEIDGKIVTALGEKSFRDNKTITTLNISNPSLEIEGFPFLVHKALTTVNIAKTVEYLEGRFYGTGCFSTINVEPGNSIYSSKDGVLFKGGTNLIEYPRGKKDIFYAIPDDVTHIGKSAFFEARNLQQIYIPDGVLEIGEGAFSSCSSLQEIEIPEGVVVLKNNILYGCTRLERVKIPDSVTQIWCNAFAACHSLKTLELSKNIEVITMFEELGVFSGCFSLERIDVNQDNPTYLSIDGVLFDKRNMVLLCYPSSKRDSNYLMPPEVTRLWARSMQNTKYLENIVFSENVVSIGYDAFKGAEKLTQVSFNEGLSRIEEDAFYECPKLEKVTFPKSLTYVGPYSFLGCRSLSEVTFLGSDVEPISTTTFYDTSINTVYGTPGTVAQALAGYYKIRFVPLSEAE